MNSSFRWCTISSSLVGLEPRLFLAARGDWRSRRSIAGPCARRPRPCGPNSNNCGCNSIRTFLFNALNGVAEEIPEHPAAALDMLRNLTAYLRHSLDGINHTVVTVSTPRWEGLMAYLAVQKARFGDRLHTHLDVAPEAKRMRRIASFLLQPLVENAVKHGHRDPGLDAPRIGIQPRRETRSMPRSRTAGTLDTTNAIGTPSAS